VLQVDVNVWSLLAQAAMLALSSLSLSLLSPVLNKDQGTALQKLYPFGHIPTGGFSAGRKLRGLVQSED
jgi:hypothetical protein